ncbi:MAG: YciI family protein [Fimbriimonas sp.]
MKSVALLALMAAAVSGIGQSPKPAPGAKSFTIFFYETPQGFADRTNKNSTAYWAKWTNYIGSIQKSGAMTGGSALKAPLTSLSIDKRGERKVSATATTLSGYLIITANSLKDAAAIARRSPAIADGGRVEVREVLPMEQHKGAQ